MTTQQDALRFHAAHNNNARNLLADNYSPAKKVTI
jgi:hypothetical protein